MKMESDSRIQASCQTPRARTRGVILVRKIMVGHPRRIVVIELALATTPNGPYYRDLITITAHIDPSEKKAEEAHWHRERRGKWCRQRFEAQSELGQVEQGQGCTEAMDEGWTGSVGHDTTSRSTTCHSRPQVPS